MKKKLKKIKVEPAKDLYPAEIAKSDFNKLCLLFGVNPKWFEPNLK